MTGNQGRDTPGQQGDPRVLEPVAQLWLSPVPEELLGPLLGAIKVCLSSVPKHASPRSFISKAQTLAE